MFVGCPFCRSLPRPARLGHALVWPPVESPAHLLICPRYHNDRSCLRSFTARTNVRIDRRVLLGEVGHVRGKYRDSALSVTADFLALVSTSRPGGL